MQHKSNIVSAIHNLRMAKDYFEDFLRENKNSNAQSFFKNFIEKINYIFRTMLTTNLFPDSVRNGIRNEINSDVYSVPAIAEKIELLNPHQRDLIETTIDAFLKGEKIEIHAS